MLRLGWILEVKGQKQSHLRSSRKFRHVAWASGPTRADFPPSMFEAVSSNSILRDSFNLNVASTRHERWSIDTGSWSVFTPGYSQATYPAEPGNSAGTSHSQYQRGRVCSGCRSTWCL